MLRYYWSSKHNLTTYCIVSILISNVLTVLILFVLSLIESSTYISIGVAFSVFLLIITLNFRIWWQCGIFFEISGLGSRRAEA